MLFIGTVMLISKSQLSKTNPEGEQSEMQIANSTEYAYNLFEMIENSLHSIK